METIQLMATKLPKKVNNNIEVCVLPEGKFSEESWFGDESWLVIPRKTLLRWLRILRKGCLITLLF